MVASVEKPVESLRFRLLGTLELSRGGDVLKLPASRKVRALLGYLVLASRPVARTQICELLWDVPNDPRGELRWCLSKIRGLLDTGPQACHRRWQHDPARSHRLRGGHARGHARTGTRHPEVRSRSPARAGRSCSRANCSRDSRSRAVRCSTRGSPPSGAASAASRRCCSNTWRARCRTKPRQPVRR